MTFYKGISTIYGKPIREVELRLYYNNVRSRILDAKILADCDSVQRIEYYISKQTKEMISFIRIFDTPYQTMYATVDEVISYLIVQEHYNSMRNKKQQRTDDGRFDNGNQIAYRYDVSPTLVVALKNLGLSVREIAKALGISRTTVYTRIQAYYVEKANIQ